MPYLSTQEVKTIRENLKKEFPSFRFSVTRSNHSGVTVVILAAPFNMITQEGATHESVNQYYLEDHYKDTPQIRDTLFAIHKIMDNGNKIISEDGDYGSIPKFYTTLRIGDYDKPFKIVEREVKEQVTKLEKIEGPADKVQIIEYSEKAIAVIGETYLIKDKLKALGGRFNKFLSCGAGWVFRASDLENVKTALMQKEANHV